MNGEAEQHLNSLRGHGDSPLIYPAGHDIWTEQDSAAIAKDLFDTYDKIPVDFQLGSNRELKSSQYKFSWVSSVATGFPLAALFVNADAEEVHNLAEHVNYIDAQKLSGWIYERLKNPEAIPLLTKILTVFAHNVTIEVEVNRRTVRIRREEEERHENRIAELERELGEERCTKEAEREAREGIIIQLQEEIYEMANRKIRGTTAL